MPNPIKRLNGPRDIIVTTPQSEHEAARTEAENCKQWQGGYYFRRFAKRPKYVDVGSRVFYVDMGYIRGFCVVERVTEVDKTVQCNSTEITYEPGHYIWMPANSWQWIVAIPYQGFQGFQYTDIYKNVRVIGDWMMDAPPLPQPRETKGLPMLIQHANDG